LLRVRNEVAVCATALPDIDPNCQRITPSSACDCMILWPCEAVHAGCSKQRAASACQAGDGQLL